jgi:hypothetical protein
MLGLTLTLCYENLSTTRGVTIVLSNTAIYEFLLSIVTLIDSDSVEAECESILRKQMTYII